MGWLPLIAANQVEENRARKVAALVRNRHDKRREAIHLSAPHTIYGGVLVGCEYQAGPTQHNGKELHVSTSERL